MDDLVSDMWALVLGEGVTPNDDGLRWFSTRNPLGWLFELFTLTGVTGDAATHLTGLAADAMAAMGYKAALGDPLVDWLFRLATFDPPLDPNARMETWHRCWFPAVGDGQPPEARRVTDDRNGDLGQFVGIPKGGFLPGWWEVRLANVFRLSAVAIERFEPDLAWEKEYAWVKAGGETFDFAPRRRKAVEVLVKAYLAGEPYVMDTEARGDYPTLRNLFKEKTGRTVEACGRLIVEMEGVKGAHRLQVPLLSPSRKNESDLLTRR